MKNTIISNIVVHTDEMSVAIESLQKSSIKLVLVLNNQKLVGTISDGDIRRALLDGKNLQTNCLDFSTPGPESLNNHKKQSNNHQTFFKKNV